jgi:hypothetical protein
VALKQISWPKARRGPAELSHQIPRGHVLSIDWDILSKVMRPAAVTVAKSCAHRASPEPALSMQSRSICERAFVLSAPSPLS